jgi:hypothetical protein
MKLRIIAFCLLITTSIAPAFADDFKSNDYFISSTETSFPLPSQENEGAIVVVKGDLLVIRRLGETIMFDKNLTPLNNWSQSLRIAFNSFDQRRFGERGLEGVKGAIYDEATSKLYVSSVDIEGDCARLKIHKYDYNYQKRIFYSKGVLWKLPQCVPVPELDESFPQISSWNRQGQPNISQAGGRMLVLSSGNLLLSVGNFGDSWMSSEMTKKNSTSNSTFFGKTLEISTSNKSVKIFTAGHRNIQGLLQLSNGQIVASEHGPEGGDEINILKRNSFFGWPIQTLGHQYSDESGYFEDSLSQSFRVDRKFTPPMFAWIPSIAPTQIVEITDRLAPLWQKDLLMGTLRDQSIRRLRIVGNSIIVDERIPIGSRIRDLVKLHTALYVLDDRGKLLKLDFASRKKQQ